MPASRVAVLLAVLATAVPGQETQPPRAKMTGWVADLAGKRVPNAEVHLLSWPLPPRNDVGTCNPHAGHHRCPGLLPRRTAARPRLQGHAFWRSGDETHRTAVGATSKR